MNERTGQMLGRIRALARGGSRVPRLHQAPTFGRCDGLVGRPGGNRDRRAALFSALAQRLIGQLLGERWPNFSDTSHQGLQLVDQILDPGRRDQVQGRASLVHQGHSGLDAAPERLACQDPWRLRAAKHLMVM